MNALMEKENFKLLKGEKFISSKLLDNLIKETDIKKAIVEEQHSELWFETLNGYGKIFFTNDVTYEGNVKYGLLETLTEERPSTITFPNGTKYIGTIYDNQITGKGTYYFPQGGEYTGGVLNGLRHGSGIYKSSNGVIYDGEWNHGLKHGKGKITQGNMVLEGEWKNGIIEGKGRIKWLSGNVYDGDVHENKMHGNGYIIWYDNNEKYCGQWLNNQQNGYGVHIWYEPRGEQKLLRNRYVGEWVNGARNGFGLFYYSNGSFYEGFWKNDKKEGFGVLTYPDRKQYIGNFKEDRLIDNLPQPIIQSKPSNNPSMIAAANATNNTRLPNKRTTFKSNNTATVRESTGNTATIVKGLETIKEDDESKKASKALETNKTIKVDDKPVTLSPSPNTGNTASKTRIEKSLDEIKLVIDLHDLIDIERDIKNSLKEIDNLLLRNLSFITRIYLHACGKESLRGDNDLVTSTISPSVTNETKSQFNAFGNKQEQQEEKKESFIDYDCIYNDDLYFCLDLKGLWKLLRELGLISPDLTLAIFDRIFFSSPSNFIEMFYLPETISPEETYDYLYQMIQNAKRNFSNVYSKQIDNSYVILHKDYDYVDNLNYNREPMVFKEELKINKDIHNNKQIILLRNFYEVLIRIAYLKFNTPFMALDQKLKKLIDMLKGFFKSKKKSLESAQFSSIVIMDLKLKNWEIAIESMIHSHEKALINLFSSIYHLTTSKPKLHDMTIKYSFLYKLICRDEEMRELFKERHVFSEIISFYHKDRIVFNQDTIHSSNSTEAYKYLNSLFDSEMILYEFIEVMFFISKKYFSCHKLDDEYEIPIEIILNCVKEMKEEQMKSGLVYYKYPQQKVHLMIEKLYEEEKERQRLEKLRLEEMQRYELERQGLINEDVNNYDEKEEEESESDDY